MARYLLDSQILVWSAGLTDRLAPAVVDVVQSGGTNRLFVSSVTIAELSIKVALGKLRLPGTPVELCALLGATELAFTWDHAARLASLPMLHRDPFDRLLIAQALAEDLTLVTSDAAIADALGVLRAEGGPRRFQGLGRSRV